MYLWARRLTLVNINSIQIGRLNIIIIKIRARFLLETDRSILTSAEGDSELRTSGVVLIEKCKVEESPDQTPRVTVTAPSTHWCGAGLWWVWQWGGAADRVMLIGGVSEERHPDQGGRTDSPQRGLHLHTGENKGAFPTDGARPVRGAGSKDKC